LDPTDRELNDLVEQVRASRKYRSIAPETIRDLLRQELPKHPRRKAGLAAARKKLHQVVAGYLADTDFDAAERSLTETFEAGGDEVERACAAILATHASSRERLDELAATYRLILERTTRKPRRVVDLACALHPLGWRWMGLDRSVEYLAYDFDTRVVELVDHYFRLEGVGPGARLRDVACEPPDDDADLALLLKMYHCLESRRRGLGWEVVAAVPARWSVVSFPTRNLRGQPSRIVDNHLPHLARRAAEAGWRLDRADVDNEAFVFLDRR
jgi:16S rRNA (guanine(1405)-N(7))-methyltransferase